MEEMEVVWGQQGGSGTCGDGGVDVVVHVVAEGIQLDRKTGS